MRAPGSLPKAQPGRPAAARSPAAEVLRRSPLFGALGEAALARLIAASALQTVPKGATLVGQGDTPRALHIVIAGSVGLRAVTEAGATTLLGLAGPGQPLLLCALLLDAPADTAAEALTASQILSVPAAAFRALLVAEPGLAAAATRLMAARCRELSEQLVDVKARTAEERLIRFLDGRAAANDDRPGISVPVELPEPRGAIAHRLGITPESLSRVMGGLERRGVIHQQAGRLSLLRPAAREPGLRAG
jgi:CRP-like cAMP-binding protein